MALAIIVIVVALRIPNIIISSSRKALNIQHL
jgi:hypothetical protein